jgi:hypothetical protein
MAELGGLKYSILHKYHHADYEVAKDHMRRQLGSLDLLLFGRQVLVGIYIPPLFGGTSSLQISDKMQAENVYQGKIVLVLKTGPAAFGALDDESYRAALYGDEAGVPKIGDWLMVNAVAGEPTNFCGPGAETIFAENRRGDPEKVYHWEAGWPCRIIMDDSFIGRVTNPHNVV